MKYPSEVIRLITELLFVETPQNELKHADTIIVFGSEFIEGTIDAIEKLYEDRIIDSDSKVILSGKTGSMNAGKESEAIRMYAEATRRNLPKEIFIVEDQATNALENLKYSKCIIEKQGGFEKTNSILFICMAFMARRTQMCAANLGFPIEKIQYYGLVNPNLRNISKDSWWERDDSCSRVLAEIQRIAQYTEKGDLTLYC